MYRMFTNAQSFNQDISSWDVSSGPNMEEMFDGADALSDENKCAIHISWSTQNAAWPYDWGLCPFQTTAELQTAVDLWTSDKTTALSTYGEINTWDVSLITDMEALFRNKNDFNDDISNWDVSNVTTMYEMFKHAKSFNQDIGDWDVSSVTRMNILFYGAQSFNQDISLSLIHI